MDPYLFILKRCYRFPMVTTCVFLLNTFLIKSLIYIPFDYIISLKILEMIIYISLKNYNCLVFICNHTHIKTRISCSDSIINCILNPAMWLWLIYVLSTLCKCNKRYNFVNIIVIKVKIIYKSESLKVYLFQEKKW